MNEGNPTLEEIDYGDLGNGMSKVLPPEHFHLSLDSYYNSERFIIGYHELQNKLSEPCNYYNGRKSKEVMIKKRQSLCLPLKEISKPELTTCFSNSLTPPNASNYSSDSGTPTSELDSPTGSCFNPSSSSLCFTSSFLTCGVHKKHVDYNKNKYNSENSVVGLNTKRSPSKIQSLLGGIKNAFQLSKPDNVNLNRRMSSSLSQLYELQEQIETYRKLSESKRQAAELLKYQLMETLYKKVVIESEKKCEKKKLEEELQRVEWQLRLLQSTTEISQRDWGDKFDSIMKEKNKLIELLKTANMQQAHVGQQDTLNIQVDPQNGGKDYRRSSV